MRLTTTLAAPLLAVICFAPIARGGLVSWSIDSSQSQLRLAIPDQVLDLGDLNVTVRMRNQTGGSTSWNVGNVASVAGTLLTDYVDGPSPTIQFLPSTVGQTVGVDSGSYRPNLANYTGGTVEPNGSATGGLFSSTASAPAVYGGLMRATVAIVTSDFAYLSFSDLSYSASSGALNVDPVTGQFDASQTAFGILNGLMGVDLASTTLPVTFPDSIIQLGPFSVPNTLSMGLISTPADNPQMRKLTLPILVPFYIEDGDAPISAILTGSIVATALVPEPSSVALLACGAMSLVWLAVSRRRAAG
jgi:hypothetical protein